MLHTRSCVNKPLLHAQIQLSFLLFVIQEFDVT